MIDEHTTAANKVGKWPYHPDDESSTSWRKYEAAAVPVLSDHQRSETHNDVSSSSAGTSTVESMANAAVSKAKSMMRNKYSVGYPA